jgi:hypothetical protein
MATFITTTVSISCPIKHALLTLSSLKWEWHVPSKRRLTSSEGLHP